MTTRAITLIFLIQLFAVFAIAQDEAEKKIELTPAQLQARIDTLVPDLVAATVGISVGMGSGSGVIVTPQGLVLTAAHVTGAPGTKLTFLLADGRELPGTALGVDHGTDAGIARIDSPGPFPFQPYVSEKNYDTGDWALALGHPGGPHIGRPSPVRLGRINRAGTESGFADPISTTAFVISGDSGGPLFDLEGRVIGINSNVSGNWDTNNHVPLPAFIKVWKELNAGETIAGEEGENEDPGFEDPFRFQRDYFFAELAKRPDDPAAGLLKRPRLLDPHQIQEHLDRWARESSGDKEPFDPDNFSTGVPAEPEQAPVARLGLSFDGRSATAQISKVEPGSPAERAGLAVGDEISSLDGKETPNARAFAHVLKKAVIDPKNPRALELALVAAEGESKLVQVMPELVPARRYFRQPLSVLSDMMLSSAAAIPLSEQLRKRRDSFRAGLPKLGVSVLEIKRDGRLVTLATAVSNDLATAVSNEGVCLTKASEITDAEGDLLEGLAVEHDGAPLTIELRGIDPANDLALIKIAAEDLVPAVWDGAPTPATGSLLIAPMPNGEVITGMATQPIRPAPKVGFDHVLVMGETPPFLGVSLSTEKLEKKHPSVELIEPDSPAELAGFLEGDVILSVGDEEISDEEELIEQIKNRQPGEKLTITVERGDRKLDLKPILGTRGMNRHQHSPMATRVDQSLLQLSARGGTLNRRRQGFPSAIYHDTKLDASICGGPLFDVEGRVVGINISRSLRHRTLAIPAKAVQGSLKKMLKKMLISPSE